MRDSLNCINPLVAIAALAIADGSTRKSGAIDVKDYDSCTFVIHTGDLADVDATWTVVLKEGDDATQTNHTPVSADYIVGSLASAGFGFADDNKTRKIGYAGTKRYCSIEIVNGVANTGNAVFGAIAVLGNPKFQPTANPPAA